MERIIGWKEKILRGCRDHSRSRGRRLGHWLVVIAGCAGLVGCGTLKKAALVSTIGTTGALIGNGVAGTAGLIAGGVTTAFVTDVVTATPIGKKAMSEMSCAPDNMFTALGDLISVSGYGIILIIIIPMIFSWLLPGPVKFKTKKD